MIEPSVNSELIEVFSCPLSLYNKSPIAAPTPKV